jgi:L-fuconolactonase
MAMATPRIDGHQHFWRYEPREFAWIDDKMAAIRRDFLPRDLAPLLAARGFHGCIAVQAVQSLDETRFLLDCARRHPFVRGVVGWVDLRAQEVDAQLREFAGNPRFVGVRHVVQSEPDPRFLLQPEFVRGIAALQPFDLAYDLLLFPWQLPAAIELCARFPQQRFVLDHFGKPRIAAGEREPWAGDLQRLALLPNVACKLSGMVTEADWRQWTPAGLKPYVDTVLSAFGPERLLFGSDWPVCLLACDHGRWADVVESLLAQLSPAQRAAVFGGNAARWYRLAE